MVPLSRGTDSICAPLPGAPQRIHDQLNLPGGDRISEEILLEQRELATAYRYSASVGIGYSFGSIFNTVVNPRMRGVGGGRDFD